MAQLIVGFSRSSKKFAPFSWLIMWAEKTNYSHSYVKYFDTVLNRWVYFQASHTAVNYMSEERFLAEEIVVKEFSVEVSDDVLLKIKEYALDTVGAPYGVMQCFGMAYVMLMKMWFNKSVLNPLKNGKQDYVCSELVYDIITEYLGDSINLDADTVTPKDVYDIMVAIAAKQ